MKRIGIDGRLYFQTGVGTYLQNLLFNLHKIIPLDWEVFVYLIKEDFSKIDFAAKNFIKKQADFRWHSFKEQLSFCDILKKHNLDLVHFTYFSYPILYPKPFVSTIHDITPLLFKTGRASTKNIIVYEIKHAFLKTVFNSQIKKAKNIITPSKTVKKQLIDYYGKEYENKIVPIYEGINQQLIGKKQNNELKRKFKKDFIIYIGNYYPHKNVERLICAFSKVKKDVQLILVGPDDYFSKKVSLLIKKLHQENRILMYHNAKLSDLVFFYNNALFLIHPSLSEGFGLPIIEAMHFNLPVVASNIDVFKEVLENQYVSFNPYDISDIYEKINYAVKDKLSADYSKIIKRYSFKNMAEETYKIYESNI